MKRSKKELPKMKKATAQQLKVQRYVLTGIGLGIYFGWFFRPLREPSIWTPIILAATVAIVMTLLRLWREGKEGSLRYAGSIFLRTALGIALLELRHPIFNFGGRIAVIVMMMIAGGLFGYWWAVRQP